MRARLSFAASETKGCDDSGGLRTVSLGPLAAVGDPGSGNLRMATTAMAAATTNAARTMVVTDRQRRVLRSLCRRPLGEVERFGMVFGSFFGGRARGQANPTAVRRRAARPTSRRR